MRENSVSRFGNVDTNGLFTIDPVGDWLDLKAREVSMSPNRFTVQ